MVESGREYVLQWPGHAAYVTERFSGLLARQSLVDVTLICDEQKLRVHKLVLASASLYFEELLKEELGSEPIILLRDLDFNILKAMIEFMYCGETTVSHIVLPSLLTAARSFKVKELESLVEKMVGSPTQDHNDNEEEYLSKDVRNTGRVNGVLNNDDNGIRVSFTNKHTNNGQSTFGAADSSDSETEKNYLQPNMSDNLSASFFYEENNCNKLKNQKDYKKNKPTSFPTTIIISEIANNTMNDKNSDREKSVESASGSTSSSLDSEQTEKESESILYERCCNYINNGYAKNEDRSQVYIEADSTPMDQEVNRVGQCSKVYTHKKRKVNNGENNAVKKHMFIEKMPSQSSPPNHIDLVEESSNDETPVTLETNLESESTNYLLSFSNESIQSIVGCSLNEFCTPNSYDLLNARTHLTTNMNEKGKTVEEESHRPAALRRSERIHQQESEETFSRRRIKKSKLRDDKKSKSSRNMKFFQGAKRKNKELERKVPNVKVIVTASTSTSPPSTKKSHSRPLRKSSKPGRCPSSKNNLSKNEKEVHGNKSKAVNSEKGESVSASDHFYDVPTRTYRNSTVNRALWGDMSDVAEDGEISDEFLEYCTSAEIPFAVGLLPLRAALERMQNTLDHQPRKTRSSVASIKLDSNNLKRKYNGHCDVPSIPKKQNTSLCTADEKSSSAFCHIEIRSSAGCSKPRKRSLSDGANNVGHSTVSGRP